MSEWKKVKIGEICQIIKGTTGIASAKPGEYPLVVTALERKTCSSFQFDCEAVCIPLVSSSGHGKKSLNNVHYQKGKFALGTILCAVIPNNPNELDARFLHQYLQFYKDKILVPLMKGAANVSLSMKDIAKVEIPLPSIEKQHKLSELFVETQKKYKELLEESEKQKSYVKLLRQNILQEAIEGKLTEEWRKENPVVKGNPDFDAEALFEKIQEEKCHTDSELPPETSLRIRNSKKKVFESILENEQPFEIPEGWKWVRLGEVIEYTENLDIQKKLKETDSIKYVDIDSIDNQHYEIRNYKEKNVSELSSRARRILKKDYIIYSTVRPYLCNIAIIKNEYTNFIGSTGFNVFRTIGVIKEYIFYFLLSDYIVNFYKGIMQGFNSPSINNQQFENTKLPLPPLAEQKEIVSRVEKLLANVTELEKQITERETLTKQLMLSIMKDAFRETGN